MSMTFSHPNIDQCLFLCLSILRLWLMICLRCLQPSIQLPAPLQSWYFLYYPISTFYTIFSSFHWYWFHWAVIAFVFWIFVDHPCCYTSTTVFAICHQSIAHLCCQPATATIAPPQHSPLQDHFVALCTFQKIRLPTQSTYNNIR